MDDGFVQKIRIKLRKNRESLNRNSNVEGEFNSNNGRNSESRRGFL